MKVGVFTALLADFPLDKVLEKLKTLNIGTVELGTGNYPGDPHCKLDFLENAAAHGEAVAFQSRSLANSVDDRRLVGALRDRDGKSRIPVSQTGLSA